MLTNKLGKRKAMKASILIVGPDKWTAPIHSAVINNALDVGMSVYTSEDIHYTNTLLPELDLVLIIDPGNTRRLAQRCDDNNTALLSVVPPKPRKRKFKGEGFTNNFKYKWISEETKLDFIQSVSEGIHAWSRRAHNFSELKEDPLYGIL